MIAINSIHPKVLQALQDTIKEAKIRGLNVGLHSGLRSVDEQNRLYSLGRTVKNPDGASTEKPMGNIVTNSQGYESYHVLGLAGDIVFKHEDGGWTWNVKGTDWTDLGNVGKLYGLEWGGDWKFKDYPHFQMRGKIENVRMAKDILLNQGLDALWAMV